MTVINTNISATLASNAIKRNDRDMTTAMERLSTGLRINSAGDDAAGLAIAARMRSQVDGLEQAARNVGDGISMLQVAEGAVSEISKMLGRMKELAVQAFSGTYSDTDRNALDLEIQELKSEMKNIVQRTSFNGRDILAGHDTPSSNTVVLQAGDNTGQELPLSLGSIYRTVWSTTNNWTGRTLTNGNDNRYQSYGYAIDFTDATGPVNLGDFDPSVHSSFKFTVIDAVGNEVPVLLRITNAIREAVLTGPPLTLTTNDPEVAGIGGGRDSLFSVLSGAGHTGIRVRFGTNNSGNPATNSVQIWSPTQNQYFSVKNNQLDLLTGDIADVDIVGLESKAASEAAIGQLDAAVTNILSTRARYGSFIGRLQYAQDNLMNVAQNTDASRSRIEDADYAAETSELARTQIISQASTAMLAQANQSKQSVLALLQG